MQSQFGDGAPGGGDLEGPPPLGREALERRATEGDVVALMEVARLRIAAGGVEALAGAAALERADALGAPEAAAGLAALSILGLGRPRDLEEAFRLLARAAAGGHARAAASLGLLAAGPLAAEPLPARDRLALARTVDVAAWLAPPPAERLFEEPRVRRLRRFVGPGICRFLVDGARGRATPARVYDGTTGAGLVLAARSNSAFEPQLLDLDPVLILVRERIARAANIPPIALEPPQFLHYRPGERFELHHDYLDPEVKGLAADLRRRGQRIATALLYLNAGFDGGATEFPELPLAVRAEEGEVLLFANVDRAGRPDPRTLHRGAPPTRGEKWVLSQWIRDRAPQPREGA